MERLKDVSKAMKNVTFLACNTRGLDFLTQEESVDYTE